MPALGELTVWSNMIHYRVSHSNQWKGKWSHGRGVGGGGGGGRGSFSLKVERLLKLCTPIPLTRGIRQGLKSKASGKGRGSGGPKCLCLTPT